MSNKNSARPLGELDKASRENLERILALQPYELNEHDRAFMRARQDYLDADQKADYVIEEKPAETNTNTNEEDDTYDKWGLDDLKAEVEARGLTITGNKNAKLPYINALEADDEAKEENA